MAAWKKKTVKDIKDSLKLTREQRLLVERLGDMPRDQVSPVYKQSPHLIKVHGVWKQLWF